MRGSEEATLLRNESFQMINKSNAFNLRFFLQKRALEICKIHKNLLRFKIAAKKICAFYSTADTDIRTCWWCLVLDSWCCAAPPRDGAATIVILDEFKKRARR
jgi:hypothetical protein